MHVPFVVAIAVPIITDIKRDWLPAEIFQLPHLPPRYTPPSIPSSLCLPLSCFIAPSPHRQTDTHSDIHRHTQTHKHTHRHIHTHTLPSQAILPLHFLTENPGKHELPRLRRRAASEVTDAQCPDGWWRGTRTCQRLNTNMHIRKTDDHYVADYDRNDNRIFINISMSPALIRRLAWEGEPSMCQPFMTSWSRALMHCPVWQMQRPREKYVAP